MTSWVIKTFLQNVIGRLPKSYWWNRLFQKYIARSYYPSRQTVEDKLFLCRQHLNNYLEFSPKPQTEFKALELGTGPWPIVPLGLYLCGASDIWTYDIVPIVRSDNLRRTLEIIDEFGRKGLLNQILETVWPERLRRLEELLGRSEAEAPAQLLEELNIHVHTGDARSTKLPQNSVDLLFSTVVLELIEAGILNELFAEFKRAASPDAIMSHYVGLGDQFAGFDKSITPYNFLKYSDRQWRFLNNPIIPQNRLPIADYRRIFQQTGWEIIKERNTTGSPDDLNQIRLAPEFTKYPREELLILFSWLVARPI
jgi:hypothetical protein